MQEEENGSHELSRNFLEVEGARNGISQEVSGALWRFSPHSAFPRDWKEPTALNLVLGNATGEGRDTHQPLTCFPNPHPAEVSRQGRG